jgi:signal transduction histidine kinase
MGVLSRMVTPGWVLGVAVAVVVQDRADSTLVSDLFYLGVMVIASAVAWVGVARRPHGDRTMRGLIACGISLSALGDVTWAVLDRMGAGTDASVADLAWFGSYVFLCAALWRVLSSSRPGGRVDLDFVVDAVTIVVISVLAFWTFAVDEIATDTSTSPFVRIVWSSYPVADAVLLALVLRVLLSARARAVIDVWFGVGVALWLTADVLYIHLTDTPWAVSVMNAAWMVAPVLIARAAWREPRVDQQVTAPGQAKTGSWVGKMLLAVLPLAVPPVLELIADLGGREDRPVQLLVGVLLLMVLAMVRTGRLIRSEQQARRELEVTRDAALAASEAKSMFLANMSHELRTPLTTVLVAGGLLAETPLTDAQRGLLERVQRAGGNLQTLVEGLLDFSRIEAGRAVLDKAELDLHALLGEVVDARLPLAQGKGVELAIDIDPRLPVWVLGDRIRVFQVLSNLVENALKFTEVGRVVLTARPGPADCPAMADPVEFLVSDTGIGIREEDFASIFESFSQVDPSSTRRYQGTGLGLAICKQLTELMGGTIDVDSELGVGTTFTVRLPLPSPRRDGPSPTDQTGDLTVVPPRAETAAGPDLR